MPCARSLPLLFGAAVLAWIIVSVMYPLTAEAETCQGLGPCPPDGSGSAVRDWGELEMVSEQKDIDAIMKKLGMASAP